MTVIVVSPEAVVADANTVYSKIFLTIKSKAMNIQTNNNACGGGCCGSDLSSWGCC